MNVARRMILAMLSPVLACFTGEAAQGLPCSNDRFCAGLACEQGFCSGPPDTMASATVAETGTTVTTSTGTSTDTGIPGECPHVVVECWALSCFTVDDADIYDTLGRAVDLQIGGMNAEDTLPDLVTVNFGAEGIEPALELRLGEDGAFASTTPLSRSLASVPDSMAIGRLDAGDFGDVVVAYRAANEITLFLRTGDEFTPVGGAPIPTGPLPRDPAVANFVGGAPNDVAYVVSSGIEILTDINSTNAAQQPIASPHFIEDMVPITLGDEHDVLLVTHMAANSVAIYAITGAMLEERRSIELIPAPNLIAAGDLDGDGRDDAVVLDVEGRIVLVPAFVSPDEAEEPVVIGQYPGTPRGLQLADLDGDCDLDVAILSTIEAENDVVVLRNAGDGTLEDLLPLNQLGTFAMRLADLDDDGRAEIIVAVGDSTVSIVRHVE